MSIPPFEYWDEHGTVLRITALPGAPLGGTSVVYIPGHGKDCHVLAEHRAKVAAGLWTGAGAAPPVILDRPGIGPEDTARVGSLTAGLDGHGNITVRFGSAEQPLGPEAARQFAASIAAYCDLAGQQREKPAPRTGQCREGDTR